MQQITVRLPDDLLDELEVENTDMSRSEYIRDVLGTGRTRATYATD
jgi:metal-responsive CopG/Arc/MetJ family transcriptional regulator